MGEVNELVTQKSAAQINSTAQETNMRITSGIEETSTTSVSSGSGINAVRTTERGDAEQQLNGDLLQNGENKLDDSITPMDVDDNEHMEDDIEDGSQISSENCSNSNSVEILKNDKSKIADHKKTAEKGNNLEKNIEIDDGGSTSIHSEISHEDKTNDDSVSQDSNGIHQNRIEGCDDDDDDEDDEGDEVNEQGYDKNNGNDSTAIESQDDDCTTTEGEQDSQGVAEVGSKFEGSDEVAIPVTKSSSKTNETDRLIIDKRTDDHNKSDDLELNGEANIKQKLLTNDDTGIVSLDDSEDEELIDTTDYAAKQSSNNVPKSSSALPSDITSSSSSSSMSNSKENEKKLPKISHVTTINDSDGAVVIGSDSENEDNSTEKQQNKVSSSAKTQQQPPPSQTLYNNSNKIDNHGNEDDDDDDDDCVVIEDDDTPPPSVAATADHKRKGIPFSADDSQSPPSKRQRTSTPSAGVNQSPQSMSQITIKDARSLLPAQQQQNKDQPPMLMYDSRQSQQQVPPLTPQSIASNPSAVYPVIIRPSSANVMAGFNSPPGAVGGAIMHSPPIGGPPKLAPVSGSPLTALQMQQQNITANTVPVLPTMLSNTNLLPGLTDDMFVLEAPSFIVPYIYEKPPTENLREIVNEIEMKFDLKQDASADQDQNDEFDLLSEQNKNANNSSSDKNNKKNKKKKRSIMDDGDDSWSESDADDDDEDDDDSDAEIRTKVLIQEAADDLNALKAVIKPTTITSSGFNSSNDGSMNVNATATNNSFKGENFFESPLGKFFMDIGIGLVQESVQCDLLRIQKRKLRRSMGKNIGDIEKAVAALSGNLEASKKRNMPFKFPVKRCEFCNFKTESALAMANHYEAPHMNGVMYRCNFCPYEIRSANDIIYHMEAMHNMKARLVKQLSYHQCPNCGFEDNGKAKLARHIPVCAKKFRPELNLAPPHDWEAPAKIPRIKPRHGLVGTATAYQAMAAQAAAQKAALASIQQQQQVQQARTMQAAALAAQNAANNAKMINRGRQQNPMKPITNAGGGIVGATGGSMLRAPNQIRPTGMQTSLLPNNYPFSGTQLIQTASAAAMNKNKSSISTGQPSISITPLPRQSSNMQAVQQHQTNIQSSQTSASIMPSKMPQAGIRPGQNANVAGGNKAQFVICEICDGYIKDLEQLRNHMQWMHKVKIHPKMIYNRPPLNCQKCQFRFFTDQGLERHLLGSHGLVTSSMQEAANKGKDAGRCPVCGRMYQWKLLNHVSRDHHMTLKPAHLSYKCTVCTATFGMYKQFETHVYTAHSTVAKKAMDGGKAKGNASSSGGNTSNNNTRLSAAHDSLLKPLKINDEITIIPQPSNKTRLSNMESHVID